MNTLAQVKPIVIAAYIEQHPAAAPTVKQHLAAIRMLFDFLVTGQIVPMNPAASVRGPKHVVKVGRTLPLYVGRGVQTAALERNNVIVQDTGGLPEERGGQRGSAGYGRLHPVRNSGRTQNCGWQLRRW